MHFYRHNIGDYRKDTGHLSLVEHGIYRALLDTYYTEEMPLCADDAKLMRTHGVRTESEKEAFKNVLNDFFFITERGYEHDRCNKELGLIYEKSDKARISAEKRWEREKQKNAIKSAEENAGSMRTHCERIANESKNDANDMLPSNPLPSNPNKKLLSSGDDAGSAKDEKQESKKLTASECQQIAELYNKALGGVLPKVTTVTPARQSAINARYREVLNSTNDRGQIRFSDKEGGMKWFGVFFGKVAAAPFLIGDNDRGWKANFDWVLAPKNFLKIVEGGFDQ